LRRDDLLPAAIEGQRAKHRHLLIRLRYRGETGLPEQRWQPLTV